MPGHAFVIRRLLIARMRSLGEALRLEAARDTSRMHADVVPSHNSISTWRNLFRLGDLSEDTPQTDAASLYKAPCP